MGGQRSTLQMLLVVLVGDVFRGVRDVSSDGLHGFCLSVHTGAWPVGVRVPPVMLDKP
jgi:hypothetical protein